MLPSLECALAILANMSDKDFIETYFKIINKDRQEVPFQLNPIQNDLEANWAALNVVLKYRKPGVSVFVQSKFLSRILRKRNRNAVVLSYDKESTQRMLERTAWTLEHLPWKVTLQRETRNEFKIAETNSKLYIGVAGSKAFGRGDDVTDLHSSEMAFWENPGILVGLLEALTNDPFVVIESTANGPNNEYAKLVRKARSGKSNWKFHFYPWWIDAALEMDVRKDFAHTEDEIMIQAKIPQITNRKLAWRRWKLANMVEPEMFCQEFPATIEEAFLVLGDCVFDKRALFNLDKIVKYPEHIGYLSVLSGGLAHAD